MQLGSGSGAARALSELVFDARCRSALLAAGEHEQPFAVLQRRCADEKVGSSELAHPTRTGNVPRGEPIAIGAQDLSNAKREVLYEVSPLWKPLLLRVSFVDSRPFDGASLRGRLSSPVRLGGSDDRCSRRGANRGTGARLDERRGKAHDLGTHEQARDELEALPLRAREDDPIGAAERSSQLYERVALREGAPGFARFTGDAQLDVGELSHGLHPASFWRESLSEG